MEKKKGAEKERGRKKAKRGEYRRQCCWSKSVPNILTHTNIEMRESECFLWH